MSYFAAILLVQFAAADLPSTHVDLVSSSRVGGQQSAMLHPAALPRRRTSRQQLPPADQIPQPAFPSAIGDAPRQNTHMPVGHAAARALLVVAAVVIVQTLGDHSALPAQLRAALLSWQVTRTQWPLVLATASAFCLYGASDVLSQCAHALAAGRVPAPAEEHEESDERGTRGRRATTVELDLKRTLRTGTTASLLSGLLAVFYFGWLERTLGSEAGHGLHAWLCLALKIAVDVGVYEPIFDTCYVTLQALLRGESLGQARAEVARKVPKVWAMAPRYWIAADALNFGVMPLRLRPMTNALLSIPWGMYLSAMANA